MDTFFPSLKFWYFPFSVSKKLAFKYAKRSNQLTLERMYIESKKVTSVTLSYTFYEIDLHETASYFYSTDNFLTPHRRDIDAWLVDPNRDSGFPEPFN